MVRETKEQFELVILDAIFKWEKLNTRLKTIKSLCNCLEEYDLDCSIELEVFYTDESKNKVSTTFLVNFAQMPLEVLELVSLSHIYITRAERFSLKYKLFNGRLSLKDAIKLYECKCGEEEEQEYI
jgi:hypothetical protein